MLSLFPSLRSSISNLNWTFPEQFFGPFSREHKQHQEQSAAAAAAGSRSGAMGDMKKGNDLFLTEEQVILGVIDEAWQRETLPDDTLVFSGLGPHQSLLSNDVLDVAETERKEKEEGAEKWTYHGLSQYT